MLLFHTFINFMKTCLPVLLIHILKFIFSKYTLQGKIFIFLTSPQDVKYFINRNCNVHIILTAILL